MKIDCYCGGTIYDSADNLPCKGNIIPDQNWHELLDAIDEAIEGSGPTAKEKEAACGSVP